MVTYADLKAADERYRLAEHQKELYNEFKALKAEFERPFIEAAVRGARIYYRRRGSKAWRIKGTQKNQWDGLNYEYVIEFDNVIGRLRENNSPLHQEAALYIEKLENEIDRLRLLNASTYVFSTDRLKES